jgi:AraC-like DNA-binding protein
VERCGRRDKSELIGRRADEVFPLPLGRGYREQDEQVLDGGLAIRDQLELHFYPTGQCGWCITNKIALRGHDGRIAGLYGASKDLQGANEKSEDFSQVAEAVRRIRTEYGQPLHVGDLAGRAGLSVYQFEQRIRRIFHVSAGQLVQKIRLEAAVEQLRETEESIATIAVRCGYSDQSAFTRKFRETVAACAVRARTIMLNACGCSRAAAAARSPRAPPRRARSPW